MRFEKTTSAGFLANHMARLFARHLSRSITPLDLAPAQFMTLLELWERDGLTQAELVERLDVEQATLAITLKRMERDGLIERRPHPEDGRAKLIWTTERARALESEAKALAAGVNAVAMKGMSDAEKAQFTALMGRAISNLQNDDA